jgi:tripartite-type tricarboxylate transporter receptor subunit TctC
MFRLPELARLLAGSTLVALLTASALAAEPGSWSGAGSGDAGGPAASRGVPPASRSAPSPWPAARAVTLIVPFAAKGPTDNVARALAAELAVQLNRPVVVENRAGAGGTAGAAAASRAAPDGATLLIHHIGMATAPALYRSLPYDPRRDFEPVGRVVDVPMTLVARTGFPALSLPDAVRHIRRHQDSIVVAYAGLGSASHLCGLLLSVALEVDLIQVPYRGTGPALQDLQDNQADLMCDQTSNTTEPIRTGRIRALAVVAPRRLPGMPSVPTVAEAGIRGLDLSIWHGLFAPRGTPKDVVERLALALQAALVAPAFVRAMFDMQVVVATREQATPAGLAALLAAESTRWAPILVKAGQYAD